VVAVAPQGGVIQGTVKASGFPLPGVSVTATNTLTGKKFATTTDVSGAFQMTVPRNGRYVIKTELTGFASTTQEVVVNASSENGGLPTQTAELKMDLASRVTTTTTAAGATSGGAAGTTVTGRAATTAVARVGRGTQSLAVQGSTDTDQTDASAGQTTSDIQLPSVASSSGDDTSATESIAVSGQQGQTNGLAGFSEDDLRSRIQDMQRNGFGNGDIATTLSGVMQTGTFGPGPGGPGGGGGFGPGGGGAGGGFGGGGGRGGGGFNGFGGGFRGQNPNAWHGTFAYTGANSALNADSRSFTGTPIVKPQSDRNTLIASFTGTPYIPGWIKPNPKQFLFFSVQETRNSNPSTSQITVPTLAQRYGDLTPSTDLTIQSKPLIGTVYDPYTGQPYGNTGCDSHLATVDPNHTACIPLSEMTAAAQALLNYYPLPNIAPNTGSYDNYQQNFPGSSHSSQISARYNRSFGATPVRGQRGAGSGRSTGGTGTRTQNRNAPPTLRQSIAENFAYSHSASSSASFSPLLNGSSVSNGYSLSSSYTVGYGRINSTATLSWSRSHSNTINEFTNGSVNPAITPVNPPADLSTYQGSPSITVGTPQVYATPFNYGIPSISVGGKTGFSGLNDTSPSDSINQTYTFTDFVSWSHKKHNMRYGLDFHRIHNDSNGSNGVLGSFTFSGYSTESLAQQTCNPTTDPNQCKSVVASGSSVADFLIGLPQQTSITAGLNKIYMRGNSWDWYAQDDWRAKSNLTISYGLRWEYFSPYSEENNHLVNLDISDLANIHNVCPISATGCQELGNQSGLPASLVKPDKAMYSPRVAIAWSPKYKWTKLTVVRSSYGINYNTGQYQRFASKMSFQQPFAVTQTNTLDTVNSQTTCGLPSQVGAIVNGKPVTAMSLTSGFGCSTQSTQSNFGVNPNYRLGMVQVYNLGIQRTLPQGVVLNIDYTGAYATNQDIVRAPNRNALGVRDSNSGLFTYEDSLGYQRSNALAVNVRERMHKGVSLGATYTYSHSIDDASSVGGSGNSIAQDDQNLGAEESNSSFDRRQSLSGNFIIEPPFGPNRAFFNKGGIWAQILDGYSISGNFTFASGSYATPQYSGTTAEIAAGAGNSLRPNRVPGQSIKGAGSRLSWFNTAAFAGACSDTPVGQTPSPYCLQPGTYGTASRNSIELPGTVSLSGSLSRTVNFGGTRSFEARITANNALNTVQYSGVDTNVNSQTFGQVTSAAGMRSFNYTARYRF
jgi:hypothetical protein